MEKFLDRADAEDAGVAEDDDDEEDDGDGEALSEDVEEDDDEDLEVHFLVHATWHLLHSW